MLFYDFEVFKYDWLVCAIDPIKQEEFVIVNSKDDLQTLYNEYKKDVWCGYNSRNYDQWILKAILCGFNPKEMNDWIIVDKKKGHEFSSLLYRIKLNDYDVMPNIPVSLKALEGFLGKNIHETSVPFDIDRKLTSTEIAETIDYCRDDVMNLIDVFLQRKSEFDSQFALVKEFNLPLSSIGKTQAQLAAQILGAQRVKLKDEWEIRMPECLQLGKYQYVADWFMNPENHNEDFKLETQIGGIDSVVAWGGLHGGIKKFVYECKDDEVILDADIGQMYPNIMIHYDLQSRGVKNKKKLPEILETSMRLKREGKKKEREPYKRICNIVYGAEGDRFNPMYDALHRKLVCIYGQVLMIDLIDKIEDIIKCLNHNTDGIFFVVKKKDIPELKRRIGEWEKRTHLVMEYDEFMKFYEGDVNNYIAIRSDGSYHAKGAYVKELNPLDYDLPIVNEAVKNYLLYNKPVEITIGQCNNFIEFQKIVKLSSKYSWVEHEQTTGNIRYDNKAYRVFASSDPNDGRLLKCKYVDTVDKITGEVLTTRIKRDKFGNTPEHCFIYNDSVIGVDIPAKLDKTYYIDLAKKRLFDKFGVEA